MPCRSQRSFAWGRWQPKCMASEPNPRLLPSQQHQTLLHIWLSHPNTTILSHTYLPYAAHTGVPPLTALCSPLMCTSLDVDHAGDAPKSCGLHKAPAGLCTHPSTAALTRPKTLSSEKSGAATSCSRHDATRCSGHDATGCQTRRTMHCCSAGTQFLSLAFMQAA